MTTKENESVGKGQTQSSFNNAPARAQNVAQSAAATEALRAAAERHKASDQRGKAKA
jgi:hypothetical protein